MKPHSLRHAVLHLMDYLGDAAKIAEHLDHGEEGPAILKAKALLEKRFAPATCHWDKCADALEAALQQVASGNLAAATRDEPPGDEEEVTRHG